MCVLSTSGHHNSGLWITHHLGAASHQVIVTDCRVLTFGLKSRQTLTLGWILKPDDPAVLVVGELLRPVAEALKWRPFALEHEVQQ